MDDRGKPQLMGVSLRSTYVEKAVFKTMGFFHMKAGLIPPAVYTNQAQMSNFFETTTYMTRAGLLATNPPILIDY
jgi:hypothetical protein